MDQRGRARSSIVAGVALYARMFVRLPTRRFARRLSAQTTFLFVPMALLFGVVLRPIIAHPSGPYVLLALVLSYLIVATVVIRRRGDANEDVKNTNGGAPLYRRNPMQAWGMMLVAASTALILNLAGRALSTENSQRLGLWASLVYFVVIFFTVCRYDAFDHPASSRPGDYDERA